MATVIQAVDGDSLCGLAIRSGFFNCDPLRAESANQGLLDRLLKAGDAVAIPTCAKSSKARQRRSSTAS